VGRESKKAQKKGSLQAQMKKAKERKDKERKGQKEKNRAKCLGIDQISPVKISKDKVEKKKKRSQSPPQSSSKFPIQERANKNKTNKPVTKQQAPTPMNPPNRPGFLQHPVEDNLVEHYEEDTMQTMYRARGIISARHSSIRKKKKQSGLVLTTPSHELNSSSFLWSVVVVLLTI
jgi:hypothetical protein